MILGFPTLTASFDQDARVFINASGATDRAAVNYFVKGIKRLGLWSSMVCWPLRSTQNAGTGSTAYSLGGLGAYNGTLVNGPTWGADGITFARTSTQHITTGLQFNGASDVSFFFASNTNDDGGGAAGIISLGGTRAAGAITTTVHTCLADNGGNFYQSSFIISPDTVVARPANSSTSLHVFEPLTPVARVATNKGALASATPSSAPLGGTSPAFVIGAQGTTLGDRGFNGVMHVAIALNGVSATSTQFNSLHDLYKATLGQGLGLP
jgi:hypothetical protein